MQAPFERRASGVLLIENAYNAAQQCAAVVYVWGNEVF